MSRQEWRAWLRNSLAWGLDWTTRCEGVATLTFWEFDSPTGADNALGTLQRLQREQLIALMDGAVVINQVRDKVKPGTSALFEPH